MSVDPTVPVASTTTVPPVVPAVPAPPAPSSPPVTVEHISALHRHLDELGRFVKSEFEKVIAFVSKAAPVVETAAAAVAGAIPGAATADAIIEKAVGVVEQIAHCCGDPVQQHSAGGCSACSCTLGESGARVARAP